MNWLRVVFIACLFSTSVSAQAANRQKQSLPILVSGLKDSVEWRAGSADKEVDLGTAFKCVVRPVSLVIGRDHPNGTRIEVLFRDTAVDLFLVSDHLDGNFNAFDEFGFLKPGYYIQAGIYDFDHRGVPEVVVAVGDGLVDLHVTVFQFHPPANETDAIRLENWNVVGSFDGQTKAYVDNSSIDLPFGSAGLQAEYTWVKHKFVETDDLSH